MDLLTIFKVFISILIGCVVGYFIREREYKRENKHINLDNQNKTKEFEDFLKEYIEIIKEIEHNIKIMKNNDDVLNWKLIDEYEREIDQMKYYIRAKSNQVGYLKVKIIRAIKKEK